MKLVYRHRTRETTWLIDELFSHEGEYSIQVESNRKGESITSFENTSGGFSFKTNKKIADFVEEKRIFLIENSEPTQETRDYWEVKRDKGFA